MSDKKHFNIEISNQIERNTLQQLCLSRKKQNFQLLKIWDQNRAKKLMIHHQICDTLDDSLQNKLSESNSFIKVLRTFIENILEQKKRYESNITNPQNKLSHNMVSKNVHMTTSRALNKLYQLNQTYSSMKKFKIMLEQAIIKINQLLEEGQKNITEFRTKMEVIVVQIQDSNLFTAQQCDKLMQIYNKDRNSKAFKSDNDFLLSQQIFMREAMQQMQSQKKLGVEIVNYLEYMQKWEQRKVILVKQILRDYMNMNNNTEQNKYEQLFFVLEKQTEKQYIQILYSPQDLIDQSLLSSMIEVQGRFQKQKFDISIIKHFLKKLQVPHFDYRNLLLKLYNIYIKSQQDIQQATLIISVDGFLNVANGRQNFTEIFDCLYSFHLDAGLSVESSGEIGVLIYSKKRQLKNFMAKNMEKQLQIVFTTTQLRDQFIDFIELILK